MAAQTGSHKEQHQGGRRVREVIKRDGRRVPFEQSKIAAGVRKAARTAGRDSVTAEVLAEDFARAVAMFLERSYHDGPLLTEDIQDPVEKVLLETGHARTARLVAMDGVETLHPDAPFPYACGEVHESERADSGPDEGMTRGTNVHDA